MKRARRISLHAPSREIAARSGRGAATSGPPATNHSPGREPLGAAGLGQIEAFGIRGRPASVSRPL